SECRTEENMSNPLNVVIDISHHDGNVNLAKAKEDGIMGVIQKATQGQTFKDRTYQRNQQKAKDVGLSRGFSRRRCSSRSPLRRRRRSLPVPFRLLLSISRQEPECGSLRSSVSPRSDHRLMSVVSDETNHEE